MSVRVSELGDDVRSGVSVSRPSSSTASPTMLRGHDGLSAYEIAVGNGYVGSEAEWINSLKATWVALTAEELAELEVRDSSTLYLEIG